MKLLNAINSVFVTCDACLTAEGKNIKNLVLKGCVRTQYEVSVYPYKLQYTEPKCLDPRLTAK